MMKFLILLPNQLFDIDFEKYKEFDIYLYEHPIFFTKYKFHKMKLAYHRATMKYYYDNINLPKSQLHYVEFKININDLFRNFKNKELLFFDPVDFDIMKEIKKLATKNKIKLTIENSKLFILNNDDLIKYNDENKSYVNSTFYKWIRKYKNILMNKDKPLKGSWSFDKDNRNPFPKNFDVDVKFKNNHDEYKLEAYNYVNKYFPENVGKMEIYLPITHKESKSHFKKFLKERLDKFGEYQDASSENINFGYHSVISPMLNIGLLDPNYVINETIKYYNKYNVNYSSVEAFIRQIISWREYVRMIYVFKHKELINNNFFNHGRSIKKSWYSGNTKIAPIDHLIRKSIDLCYLHHIERLMHIGNFMLLNMFDPKDVFKWFITVVSIDAYAWVMEPNIYGMSQFSTGDLMMTRPYFSSSNYIDKMSSFKKKKNIYEKIKLDKNEYEWYEIWDILYYYFIYKNKDYLEKNYSTANAVKNWNNKSTEDKSNIIKTAKLYFKKY